MDIWKENVNPEDKDRRRSRTIALKKEGSSSSKIPSLTVRSKTRENCRPNEKKKSSHRTVVVSSRLSLSISCPVINTVMQLNVPAIPPGVVIIDEIPLPTMTYMYDRHYGMEIISYMRQLENTRCLPNEYLEVEGEYAINYSVRALLVDWLIQVQHYLELRQESIHLCVKIIDHVFAAKCAFSADKIQLVGVASLLISCKIVERFPPKITVLVHLTDDAYTVSQVFKMEKYILNQLRFILVLPEPMLFLDRCFQVSGAKDKQLLILSRFFVDLMLHNHQCVHVLPSLVASASFCLSKKILYKGIEAEWDENYQFYAGYTEDTLKIAMQLMVEEVINIESSPYKGTWKKYSSRSRYQGLSHSQFLQPERMKLCLSNL